MILGIDVGGTHTDAVLLDGLIVRKKAKVPTNHEQLLDSLLAVTEEIFSDLGPDVLERVVLSTTMSTNAIVQGTVSPVGMIVAAGPGISPDFLRINDHTHIVSGYANHRGIIVSPVRDEEIDRVVSLIKDAGIDHLGIVGKFSTRNPGIETNIADRTADRFRHVSLGHRMSGNLNFPRRIATTYLNAAVWDIYNSFVNNINRFVSRFDGGYPIYILKADGGTFEIAQSVKCPVQTILSGPAASIMGILSLTECGEDAIALDIGGTTTDIAIFAGGVPLLEPLGVTIEGHKTLIRGLRTRSIGIGGDSRVRCEDGTIIIGPERAGPAAAFGGPAATPTDAMIVLNLAEIGDREKAVAAIDGISHKTGLSMVETAQAIYDSACEKITAAVQAMIREINNEPVYTVHELLEGKTIEPTALYVVGGPAEAMAPRLGELLRCRSEIPEHAEVANAIGAALARTTTELTILADTEQGVLTIVEEGIQIRIDSGFDREKAREVCREHLEKRAISMGARKDEIEIEITEDQSFNMVRGYFTAGKNIRIKGQVKPGLIAGLRKGTEA
ncbi:MAG: hydantoinase/oxoprolinase family protein [Deltaproteobacteria bacterium]|nr:hydantoinase/oxoprolinase family protein [Deltaproteobacteria bacterium]